MSCGLKAGVIGSNPSAKDDIGKNCNIRIIIKKPTFIFIVPTPIAIMALSE